MFLFINLVVGTLCFCFEIFVHVVNVRIFSINVYLDMTGATCVRS
jgi:hypothetical protein